METVLPGVESPPVEERAGAAACRYRIMVRGTVQGVGFRPYIYRLACSLGLRGAVWNSGTGVSIAAEGHPRQLHAFLEQIAADPPPLARIGKISYESEPVTGCGGFTIETSGGAGGGEALLPPDTALCPDCAREIADPHDRRHGYPFTNCTNCGPRFTIVRSLPYDRAATSMAAFMMCGACREEYEAPADRRFHAQPTACPACGPGLTAVDGRGRLLGGTEKTGVEGEGCTGGSAAWLRLAWDTLLSGGIIAVKGLGGFHLACDASHDAAVRELRRRKGRPAKPFAVMCRDLDTAERHCRLSKEERILLGSPAAPIVLLRRRTKTTLSPSLAPGLGALGVMLPYTPLHRLLLDGPVETVVMTSGNRGGLPLAKDNDDALKQLAAIADCFLMHDRPIVNGCDDSVAAVVDGETRLYRRSRGYVPSPVPVAPSAEIAVGTTPGTLLEVCGDGEESPVVLGAGGDMKSAFCLLRGNEAFLSQHLGELDSVESVRCYRESLSSYQRILSIHPEIAGCDLHPAYRSAAMARETAARHVGVQHHHAHLASCLAENCFPGRAVGIILDGTGYGSDGALWGFEILTGDAASYQRRCHLAYFPLPGGEQAVRNPWITATACLATFCGAKGRQAAARLFSERQVELVCRMLAGTGIPVPRACGCGRLFDAVSAILGVCTVNGYEGQAAVELGELMAECDAGGNLSLSPRPFPAKEEGPISLLKEGGAFEAAVHATRYPFIIKDGVIQPGPLFNGILQDLAGGVPVKTIALKFHHTAACMAVESAVRAAGEAGLTAAALSGGCWQNSYLFRLVRRMLGDRGFTVLTHTRVPANDGGIALGQAVIARRAAAAG